MDTWQVPSELAPGNHGEASGDAGPALPERAAPLRLLPGERKTVERELLVAFLVIGLPVIAGGLAAIAGPGGSSWAPETVEDIGWHLALSVGPISLLLFLAWRDRLGLALVGVRPFLRPADLAWGAIAYGVMVGSTMLADELASAWSLHSGATGGAGPYYAGPAAASLASIDFLVAAAREELFYRAYLWTRLTQLSGNANVSWVACAVVFAIAHGYSPAGSLGVLLFGLGVGAMYRWSRRLPGLVVAHAAYNLSLIT